jgi:PAS domain S-box-containing protein
VRPESVQAIHGIARNAFVSLDGDGRVVEWNLRATELFGYAREEALGAELAELIIPERYREHHRAGVYRAASKAPGTRRLIVEALRRDGGEFRVEVSITADSTPDATVLHAWIQDVSERAQLSRSPRCACSRASPLSRS